MERKVEGMIERSKEQWNCNLSFFTDNVLPTSLSAARGSGCGCGWEMVQVAMQNGITEKSAVEEEIKQGVMIHTASVTGWSLGPGCIQPAFHELGLACKAWQNLWHLWKWKDAGGRAWSDKWRWSLARSTQISLYKSAPGWWMFTYILMWCKLTRNTSPSTLDYGKSQYSNISTIFVGITWNRSRS